MSTERDFEKAKNNFSIILKNVGLKKNKERSQKKAKYKRI